MAGSKKRKQAVRPRSRRPTVARAKAPRPGLALQLSEAHQRESATAEILKVIASSPSDVQPVFKAIIDNAHRLCGAVFSILYRYDGEMMTVVADKQVSAKAGRVLRGLYPAPPRIDHIVGRAILERRPTYTTNISNDPRFPANRNAFSKASDLRRAGLTVPLLRDGVAIGAIAVARLEAKAFSRHEIQLLRAFADQAVIAIENVRLFNETKEALERQTATAEILRVISGSPSDVQPVFDAIVRSSVRLIGGYSAVVVRIVDGMQHLAAFTSINEAGDEQLKSIFPRSVSAGSTMAEVIRGNAARFIVDMETDPAVIPGLRETARLRGYRSMLFVPIAPDGVVTAVILVTRAQPGAFSDHHVELIRTFADQAVIAIENVRLFNETKEALERQTATAEILNAISRSPTDLQPVFDTIVRSAIRLMDGVSGGLFTSDGVQVYLGAAFLGSQDSKDRFRQDYPAPIDYEAPAIQAIRDGRIMNVPDVLEADFSERVKERARGHYRASLCVPMLRGGGAIGSIAVTRSAPGLFPENHVTLLKTFADQAVIAIENVRLFKELQSRTEALTRSVGQLTALGEVGQAISSTLELETVLQTIVSRAVQLTGLDGGSIYEYDEASEEFRLQAADNQEPQLLEAIRRAPIRKGDGTVGGTAVTLEEAQVPDILDAGYQSSRKELLIQAGYRAILTVPLLREDRVIGALSVTRKTPGPFPLEVVELLKTFATQSAMAIQNARLFRQIEEKSRELQVASEHKSQFLASMSHELRTPLNAILGLNEMMLGDIYGEVPEDMKPPLAQTQASGKHLLSLINNVLDLAKIEANRMELALSDFVVQDLVASTRATLEPLAKEKGLEFVASAPEDLPLAYGDAGRLAQCLINLAGNSLKFTKEGRVEIRVEAAGENLRFSVADTGIGIAPEKIAELFTEFKQTDATIAREYGGTGLGLAITKKFIELHGGSIRVESEIGRGSTFIFEVPLRAQSTGAAA